MRPFTDTLPFDDALTLVRDAGQPTDRTETLALEEADGRVLATSIVADQDVPAFDRAAMDGYAVLASDTTPTTADNPVCLRLTGRVFAGQITTSMVPPGTCLQISTGAPLPPGADAVVMVEHTSRRGDDILVHRPSAARQHVGPRGADIRKDEALLNIGDALTPARIGALAAIGIARVDVYAKPTVAIMCTGDEVIGQGHPLGPGQVYNVNRFTLEALVRRHGGEPVIIPTTGDSLEALNRSLALARACDLIVSSGGSSVGEHDLIVDMLRTHGEVIFHGISIKPGKPTVFGRIGSSLLLGLSGYPASCLSNAYLLLIPLLRITARLPEWVPRTVTLPLARRLRSAAGRQQFYSVRIEGAQVVPAFKASGDITSMAHADGYVTIPASTESIEAGIMVNVTLYGS